MSTNKTDIKIILIPGLGFDCRIFENLDLSNFPVGELNWIQPLPKEHIHAYAIRLFSKIKHTNERLIIIGHSLGGIIAQEIASVHSIEKVILISSIKFRKELPLYFKIVKPLMLNKLFTKELTLKSFKYWAKSHGFETEQEKDLFISMLDRQTNHYLQWALQALSSWHEPLVKPETSIVHIHGTNDKTLPYKKVDNPDFTIENGSHFCVYKKADEVNKILDFSIA